MVDVTVFRVNNMRCYPTSVSLSLHVRLNYNQDVGQDETKNIHLFLSF